MIVELKNKNWKIPEPLQSRVKVLLRMHGVDKVQQMTLQDFLVMLNSTSHPDTDN